MAAAEASSRVSDEEVRSHLEKVLASPPFVHSLRLCKFLRYVIDRSLNGESDDLKEYTLGRDVFERGDEYNPNIDSIVRVEAQRLRRKLKEYYERFGGEDFVQISLHPGRYVPTFQPRQAIREIAPLPRPPAPNLIAAGPAADPNTVAVLPFANLSTDPEQGLLCNGAAEEIIHKLMVIPQLKVFGMTTVIALQASPLGLREICLHLGVGTLIEGSVRKSGELLRISAKATEVSSGRALWSRRFDCAATDIFAVQDRIAGEVASALNVSTTAANPETLAVRNPFPNLEAYKFYLKGRQTWDDADEQLSREAIESFQMACTLAPGYALPYTGLADAFQFMAFWGWMRPREAMPMARRAALEALRIDPKLGEAYTSLASVFIRYDWNRETAEAAVTKALALNPGYSFAHSIRANCFLAAGKTDEALRSFERAVQLDPLSARTNFALGAGYWVVGQYDQAEHWLRAGHELKPDSFSAKYFLCMLYLSQGKHAQALEECTVWHGLGVAADLFLSAKGAALAANGQHEEARRILAGLQAKAEARYVDSFALATLHMSLNQREETLDALTTAVEERSPYMAYSPINPLLNPLREDPRFREIVRAMRNPLSA